LFLFLNLKIETHPGFLVLSLVLPVFVPGFKAVIKAVIMLGTFENWTI